MKTHLSNGVHEREVDQLLSDYFQRELPNPWPAASVPEPSLGVTSSRGLRRFPRLALAASIALLFAGYLMLAGMFPSKSGTGLIQDPSSTIGKGLRPVQSHDAATPKGIDAPLPDKTNR